MSIHPDLLYDNSVLSTVTNGVMTQAQIKAHAAPGLRMGFESVKALIIQDIERCFYPLAGNYPNLDEVLEEFEKKIRALEFIL